jgi:hypothetical protein
MQVKDAAEGLMLDCASFIEGLPHMPPATIFPKGTIIFPKVGGAMLTNKRRVVERDCCIDNNLMGSVITRGLPSFVFVLLEVLDFRTIAKPGPVPAISEGEVREIRVAFPPLPEEVAIVRFLGHAEQQIGRYIRAKQKIVKLLEEAKQAIINRAILRGLDLNVHLRPSGLPWLGEIPKHWTVQRNGRMFVQRNQTGFADLPILEVSLRTGVRTRDFAISQRKQVMSDRGKYKRAAQNDIAYNMMRMRQGAVGVVPVDGLVSPAYIVARPLDGVDSRYYAYLFRTRDYMVEVDKYSHGIVKDRNRLYWEDFKQIPSPYPPIREQAEIADRIDAETKSVGYAIDRVYNETALLREFRTRLIAEVARAALRRSVLWHADAWQYQGGGALRGKPV